MKVKNRLWYPPMLSFSSDKQGCPSADTMTIYEQKARGGVGLLVYEATSVDPNSVIGNSAYIGTDDNIPAYKKLTDLVHKYDVKFGMQLAENGVIHMIAKVLSGVNTDVMGPSNVDPLPATSAYTLMMPTWERFVKEKNLEIRGMDVEEIIKFENQFALCKLYVKNSYLKFNKKNSHLF